MTLAKIGRPVSPDGERVRVATGATHPWTGLHQSVPSGLQGDYRILVTPDGRSYAYNFSRSISDLYLVSNLK